MNKPTDKEIKEFFSETKTHSNVIEVSGQPFSIELIYQMFRMRLINDLKKELLSTVEDLREVIDDAFVELISTLDKEEEQTPNDSDDYYKHINYHTQHESDGEGY